MERERIDRDSMYVTCGAGWMLKDIELCRWHLGDPLRHGIPPRSRIAMIEVTFYENSQIWNLFTWGWLFREGMPFTNGCILAFIISIIFHYYCGSSPMWQQWWEGAVSQMALVVSLLSLETKQKQWKIQGSENNPKRPDWLCSVLSRAFVILTLKASVAWIFPSWLWNVKELQSGCVVCNVCCESVLELY